MKQRIYIGFNAGFAGALILIVVMFLLEAVHITGEPGFIHIYEYTFNIHTYATDVVISAILFALSGGIWGAIFGALFRPTVFRGMLFGLLPCFWVWLVIQPYLGHPVFGGFAWRGILFPLIFNCLIWGSFVGRYINRRWKHEIVL